MNVMSKGNFYKYVTVKENVNFGSNLIELLSHFLQGILNLGGQLRSYQLT
jgi:hypothetical protein